MVGSHIDAIAHVARKAGPSMAESCEKECHVDVKVKSGKKKMIIGVTIFMGHLPRIPGLRDCNELTRKRMF